MPAFSRILTLPTEMKYLGEPDPATGKRFVEGIISSGRIDRQGEVVHPAALNRALANAFTRTGGKGIPYLRDHYASAVIGKVIEFERRGDTTWTKAELLPAGKSALADELVALLDADIPLSQSIGFNPAVTAGAAPWDWKQSASRDDNDTLHWGGLEGEKDFDLLEVSAVTFGANTDADLQLGKSLGLNMDRPWAQAIEARVLFGIAMAEVEDPEEFRFFDDADRALKALTGMDNITRHWAKDGRALSPEVLDALLSPISKACEIVKAGRVLSDKNRGAVTSAIAALQEVLKRDDASRGTPDEAPADTDKGLATSSGSFVASPFLAALTSVAKARTKEADTDGN